MNDVVSHKLHCRQENLKFLKGYLYIRIRRIQINQHLDPAHPLFKRQGKHHSDGLIIGEPQKHLQAVAYQVLCVRPCQRHLAKFLQFLWRKIEREWMFNHGRNPEAPRWGSIQRTRGAATVRTIGARCTEHQAEAAQDHGAEGRSRAVQEAAKTSAHLVAFRLFHHLCFAQRKPTLLKIAGLHDLRSEERIEQPRQTEGENRQDQRCYGVRPYASDGEIERAEQKGPQERQ